MSGPASWSLRGLQAEDVDALMAVQEAAYGAGFLEPAPVQAQRLRVASDTVWGAWDGARLGAYLMAYRTHAGHVGALHQGFAPEPEGDTLYLHDLAVHPSAAGQGLGPQLVAHALHQARQQGLASLGLVAVQGSSGFWQRQGFGPAGRLNPDAQAALATYGPGAVVLVRAL